MTDMRRKDKQMRQEECESLLTSAEVGRLGVITEEGMPYVVPVNYVFANGDIFIHSAATGLKLRSILLNPRVCFEIDESAGVVPGPTACSSSYRYRSVIAFGTAEVVQDPDSRLRALEMLAKKYCPEADRTQPVLETGSKNVAVIRVRLDSITGKSSRFQG